MKEINDLTNYPEILAPAGDLERLRFAYIYGADAAYIGGGDFSLRSNAGFTRDELRQAIALARGFERKLYVAVNCFADNSDIDALAEYAIFLSEINPQGVIVSDPGVFSVIREYAPHLPLFISTQANNTNYRSAQFWAEQGAKRIILSRELSLADAAQIASRCGIETEIFVHGAICMAYSGRCLLSAYLTGRSANHGACSHPCRWNYALQEEKRPGEFFPIVEDTRGSYIMNSKDMCLLKLIPELVDGGFSSWKIEGRNKSAYYVANVTRIYRAARNAFFAERDNYSCRESWSEELTKISHRDYTTGFAVNTPSNKSFRYDDGGYLRSHDFCAIAQELLPNGLLRLEQRNHFAIGDELELLLPDDSNLQFTVSALFDEHKNRIDAARHPYQTVFTIAPENNISSFPLICRRRAR